MIRIRVPATSANLGPGFDCLGIALGLYNEFEVEPADTLCLEGIDVRYSGEDNLFIQGYRKAGGKGNLRVTFDCDIPVSRGLGSSASLLTAGALTAQILNHRIDPEALFEVVANAEGHPDNAAPSVYGGLTASIRGTHGWVTRSIPVNETLRFTVLIPDLELRTEEERTLLPETYDRETAVTNAARAVMMCEALRTGDVSLLKEAARDQFHEPYRRTMIPSFDTVKEMTQKDTGGALVISGSGSSCLLISDHPLNDLTALRVMTLPEHWDVRELPLSGGPEYTENDTWQGII